MANCFVDKALYALPLFYFASLSLYAQPNIQWQRCLGGSNTEEATSVQQTSDGGYVVAAKTLSLNGDVSGNHGANDFWVIKLNPAGDIEWKKAYGGTNHDRPRSITQTADGGYIVAGETESLDGDVSGHHGYIDIWLIKISSTGTLQWQRALGGSNWDYAESVIQANDGGYVIAGWTNSEDGDVGGTHGWLDFWVVKLDNGGEIQWQRVFGGTDYDVAHSVRQTPDGGYIVAGESKSNDGDASGQHGNGDFWVIKLTGEGSVEWQKMYGGFGSDRANDVWPTSDGGYIFAGLGSGSGGDMTGNHGSIDYWVVKTDDTGQLQWQKSLGGSSEEYALSVRQTADGGYVVGGSTRSTNGDVIGNDGFTDVWVVKLTETGQLEWQATYGGTGAEQALCIQQTDDKGFILAGYTKSINTGDVSGFHGGVQDCWIVKLSPETVSTQAPSVQPLEIFPNPAEQQITLNAPTLGRLQVRLTDLLGRQLLSQTLAPNEAMDISALPAAVYLLSATDEDGRVFAGKLIKE